MPEAKSMPLLKRIILIAFVFSLFAVSSVTFAQEVSTTVITITNARQTNYKKDEKTGNDTIILEGEVVLSVKKDDSVSEISADIISYDRKTEMLYAEGNVSIVTKDEKSGNDTATANSLLLNTSTLEAVFDGGRIVQTQSDALSLPSGSTMIVFSQIFGRSDSNVIAFKNSSLTFCDDDEPHWHIDATRTWLLPGGEFAFFNALLYVGAIPVLYLPAFYYPKDELVFNPVFGSDKRRGYFMQNTLYLYGRKPLNTDSSTSSSSSSNDATAETMKGLYNFMKPSVLKEQELQGLVLHNLDADYTGNTSEYVKLIADWYSNLGCVTGVEGVLTPSNAFFSSLKFNLNLGFSNTVYYRNKEYTFLDSLGNRTWDESALLGLKLPFRYAGNVDMSLSKPFSLTISLPFYSDPYFSNDFKTRSESMDWISYLMDLLNDKTDDTQVTISTVSSYTWQISSSYSPTLPSFIKPYVSSLSLSLNSSVNISSLAANSASLREYAQEKDYSTDWITYTPMQTFYYPSQVTPVTLSSSVSGTLFQYPASSSTSKKFERPNYQVPLVKPDELKTEKEIELEKKYEALTAALEENQNSENSNENNIINKKEDKNEKEEQKEAEKIPLIEPVFPSLDTSVASSTVTQQPLNYSLGYSFTPTVTTQTLYSSYSLRLPEDFNWNNPKSFMYTIKTPLALTSSLRLNNDFVTLSNKLSWNPTWQDHPYINTDKKSDEETDSAYSQRINDSGGVTYESAKSLKKADYTAQSRTVQSVNSLSFMPFKSLDILKNTKISWNNSLNVYRHEFIGDGNDTDWEANWATAYEDYWLKFKAIDYDKKDTDDKNDPEDYFGSHTLDVVIASTQMSEKIKESFTLSSVLWPLNPKYTGTLSISVPNTTFTMSTYYYDNRYTNSVKGGQEDFYEWGPIQQSLSFSYKVLGSTMSITQSLNWNPSAGKVYEINAETGLKEQNLEKSTIEDSEWWKRFSGAKLSFSWMNFSATYTMSYVNGYDLYITPEEAELHGGVQGYNIKSEKEFQPYSLVFSYAPSSKTLYAWKNRISVVFGLSTSLSYDFIKPTESYLNFAPSLTFNINNFFDLTFSSTSRNQTIYWYFNNDYSPYLEIGSNWFTRMTKDLIRSFYFWDESARKASGFKLKTLNMTLSHDLHDWKFNMSLSVSPRLVTKTDGKKEYRLDPYMTIGIVWNPMGSIKTEIVDKYGEWQLN